MCKLAAVLQGKCTSILVETEKNAHSQSNAVSFAVTIFLSGLTGSELCLFKNLSESVSQEKIDKLYILTLTTVNVDVCVTVSWSVFPWFVSQAMI